MLQQLQQLPNIVCLAAGNAEGDSELNAFDNALRAGRIGDVNLIRVSSIVPTGAVFAELPELPYGALVPTAYAEQVSSTPGQVISACIGVGWTHQGGVIMEAHGVDETAGEIEKRCRLMVEEGMRVRGFVDYEVRFATAEHTVERIGAAIAAAVLWWRR